MEKSDLRLITDEEYREIIMRAVEKVEKRLNTLELKVTTFEFLMDVLTKGKLSNLTEKTLEVLESGDKDEKID